MKTGKISLVNTKPNKDWENYSQSIRNQMKTGKISPVQYLPNQMKTGKISPIYPKPNENWENIPSLYITK